MSGQKKGFLPVIIATAFLELLGLSLLIPVLPEIIAEFGVSASWTAYSQGIAAIGTFIGGLFFGRLSDKYGRKNTLLFTSAISVVSYIIAYVSLLHGHVTTALGMSVFFGLFLASRFISGLGGAGFAIVQAYIADVSTKETRAKNMGMIGAAFGFAFLIGPAIGGVIGAYGIEYVLIGCIIALVLDFILIAVILREPPKHVNEVNTEDHVFRFSREVKILFLFTFGTTLAFSSIQSGSAQFYVDAFNFDSKQIGYTLSVVGIIAVVYQGLLIGHVRKFLNEKKMIQYSSLLLGISLLLFAYNTSSILLFCIIPFFPIVMGTMNPALSSLLALKAGKDVGRVMGYNTSVMSVGSIIGPFFVGFLYAHHHTLPFSISACIGFLLFVFGYFAFKK